MRHELAIVGLVIATALAGCDDGFQYRGKPGKATPGDFSGLVLQVPVSVNGAPAIPFIVDSGAPVSVLDSGSFTGPAGSRVADVKAFGVEFPTMDVQVFEVFPFQFPDRHKLGGILGGDLLVHFALTLDYEGGRAFLWDGYDGAAPPVPSPHAGAPLAVPFRRLGGGLGEVLPGELQLIPATRVVVDVSVEGQAPVPMLVDTGASFTLLDEEYLASLPLPDGLRPAVSGITVDTVLGATSANLIRVAQLDVGAGVLPAPAGAADLISMEVPGTSLLAGLSTEVGERVYGLVGGSFLSRWLVTLDYQRSALVLQPYDDGGADLGHLVSFGFDLAEAADGTVEVQDVLAPSSASAAGLAAGDRLGAIEGYPIDGFTFGEVQAIVASFGEWETVPMTFARGGKLSTLLLRVEPLLDDYPPRPYQAPPNEPQTRVLGDRP